MSATIQFRRGTAAEWSSANPTLAQGELGLVTDTGNYKIGDGSTAWNSLAYRELSGTFSSLPLSDTTDPANPSSGLLFYSGSHGGISRPKFITPKGISKFCQPSFMSTAIQMAVPSSSTAMSYVGMPAFTAVGTVSHPALATGSLRQGTRRAIVTSAGTANSASELRLAQTSCYLGDAAGRGGFFLVARFGISSAVAAQRLFVGLAGVTTAIATTQDPAALTNIIGVGWGSSDANARIMHNDASGTATQVDLGTDFVKNQQNGIYEMILFAEPNATTISYEMKRLDAAGAASGTISTDLPTTTTFLAFHAYANNGGTAAAVILDLYRFYLETDY